MGAWGFAPWENDSAADWFADLFDEVPLAAKVEETLKFDPVEYADEIRAASALLVMLGRTYVWPIEDLDRQLKLAISKMEEVAAAYTDDPELASAVAEEIAILRSRLANARESPSLRLPSSWGNFWS